MLAFPKPELSLEVLLTKTGLQERVPEMSMTAGHMQAFSGFCLNTSCKCLALFIIIECSQKC